MEAQEGVGLCCRVIQTAATSTFFGAAFYVNMVETPARRSMKTSEAVMNHFQETFPRARNMQASLAALATVSGITGKICFYHDHDNSAESLQVGILTRLMRGRCYSILLLV